MYPMHSAVSNETSADGKTKIKTKTDYKETLM